MGNSNYYKGYKNVRDAVWQLIIDMDIKELPVKVSAIIRKLGITLYKYSDNIEYLHSIGLDEITKTTDGFTLLISGRYKIFYDSSMNADRIRFTLAHELGHIICKHRSYN